MMAICDVKFIKSRRRSRNFFVVVVLVSGEKVGTRREDATTLAPPKIPAIPVVDVELSSWAGISDRMNFGSVLGAEMG